MQVHKAYRVSRVSVVISDQKVTQAVKVQKVTLDLKDLLVILVLQDQSVHRAI